jgi:hydroxymethylpyrimidine/phosphomethylpyrimidine kinase
VTIPRVLAIAGSDSGGGAGIQADIKTITMLGGHAMTAITAITAQNTLGVSGIMPVPTDMVLAQIDAVVGDIGVDAVKIGMIGSAETAEAIAEFLTPSPLAGEGRGEGIGRVASMATRTNLLQGRAGARDPSPNPLPQGERAFAIVFDPVMIATSGAVLADRATISAFERLMGVATLITPNAPELAALTGMAVAREQQLEVAAHALAQRHGVAVLAKGGHLSGDKLVDLLVRPDGTTARWSDSRIETRHNHGTGCTLSSAIATALGKGLSLEAAISQARAFVRVAMEAAPDLGRGHGPMGHGLGRAHFPPPETE